MKYLKYLLSFKRVKFFLKKCQKDTSKKINTSVLINLISLYLKIKKNLDWHR